MSADPRDAYRADVLALVIVSEAGADTLRAATAGEDIHTPAFRSETGPVILLFADPDEDVREDIPGVAVIYDFEPLPAVAEWLAGSEGAPLAQLPRALLVDAGEIMGSDVVQPLAEPPARANEPMAETSPPVAAPLADPPATDAAYTQYDSQDDQTEEPEAPPPAIDAVPVDLPAEPTDGLETAWRIQAGRLVVTRAPIDPGAVPTRQQTEAAAALVRVLRGRSNASLADWRAECRDAWKGSIAPGSVTKAFTRCRAVLEARGAVKIDGERVALCQAAAPLVGVAAKALRLLRLIALPDTSNRTDPQ